MLMHFFVCKEQSCDDVGVARGIVFQETRPDAGFKTGDFRLKKSWGGYCRTNASGAFPVQRLLAFAICFFLIVWCATLTRRPR